MSRGEGFIHNDCSRRRVFAPFKSCPGDLSQKGGMVFDEIDTCIISSPYCDSLFCPEGKVFVHNNCPGRRVFDRFKSCLEGLSLEEGVGGVVLDEIDTCIISSPYCVVDQTLK